MNTEFPSRIPTVTNNNATNASGVTITGSSTSFQRELMTIFNETVKFLESITDKVSDLASGASSNTTKKKSDTQVKSEKETENFQIKTTTVLSNCLTSINNLTNIVNDFFTNKLPNLLKVNVGSFSDEPEANTPIDTMSDLLLSLMKKTIEWNNMSLFQKFGIIFQTASNTFKSGFEELNTAWKNGMKNLQGSVENLAGDIGGAIGSVFGQGIFGRTIGKIINKSISWAVGKLLIGMIMSNLPMTALVTGIVAAVGLIVYFAGEIWEAIKWLGYAIDQGIDAILDVVGESKYKKAREEMAKATGLTPEEIKEKYGDTIRGRNQAYEEWQEAKDNAEKIASLKNELQEWKHTINEPYQREKKEYFSKLEWDRKKAGLSEISNADRKALERQYDVEHGRDKYGWWEYAKYSDKRIAGQILDETARELERQASLPTIDEIQGMIQGQSLITPVSQTTINNNTAINTLGNNVSNSQPLTSLNPNSYQRGIFFN